MEERQIRILGTYWCPDCRRCKQFLGEHQIPYTWVDIEKDPEAEKVVLETNRGKRIVPVVFFQDGSILVEPSNSALAEKLGLKTKASRNHYDLIIIGGGPAGLTAAIYTARESIDTLVIERATFGGQVAGTEQLDNMPGFPEGIGGLEFSNRCRRQAEKFGVELMQTQEVVCFSEKEGYKWVETTDGSRYSARAVLIATGVRYRHLDIPGEVEYSGAGVHFCATCDGPFYKGKHVAVIGGGNSAAQEGLFLTRFAERVTILVRKDAFRATRILQEAVLNHPKIQILWNTAPKEFIGEKSVLTGLRVENLKTGSREEMEVDGAFVFIGLTPNTKFLVNCGLLLDPYGFLVTGTALMHGGKRPDRFADRDPFLLETNIPGIFAAGDVRQSSTKQAVSAAGEGSSAALMIREYLKMV
jgi:thioredoxin reductase (NADPH)